MSKEERERIQREEQEADKRRKELEQDTNFFKQFSAEDLIKENEVSMVDYGSKVFRTKKDDFHD